MVSVLLAKEYVSAAKLLVLKTNEPSNTNILKFSIGETAYFCKC